MQNDGRLRLILTRHAKSDWGSAAQADHDRPLNGRGRRAAERLGQWQRTEGYLPGEALISTARRTCETWERSGLSAAKVRYLPELYHAPPERMLKALQTARATVVQMLGHNPGIGAFAAALPALTPSDPDFARYPTAATLVVDFDEPEWSQVTPGSGRVIAFHIPNGRSNGGPDGQPDAQND